MTREEIENWIVQVGGIIDTGDNHFGGDPSFVGRSQLNLQIQQRPGEISSLIHHLLEKKNSGEKMDYYIEIGACSGGTTRVMNHFFNFKETLVIDDGGAENLHYIEKRGEHSRGRNLGTIPRVEIIGSSYDSRVVEIAQNISTIREYDILFIDGEHTYDAVKKDTLNYQYLLRVGGYIIYHDTAHMLEIKKCINDLIEEKGNLKFIADFAQKDPYTDIYPGGVGLTLVQKIA